MKLVDLKTLLAQPVGTIFAPYSSVDIEHLMVFGGQETHAKDSFTCAELSPYWAEMPKGGTQNWIEFWLDHMEDGEEHGIDWLCWGRDSGYFEEGVRFVLLDVDDVKGLFKTLASALIKAYGVQNLEELLKDPDILTAIK